MRWTRQGPGSLVCEHPGVGQLQLTMTADGSLAVIVRSPSRRLHTGTAPQAVRLEDLADAMERQAREQMLAAHALLLFPPMRLPEAEEDAT